MRTALLISVGAVLGANLRYVVSRLSVHWLGGNFPWGTIIVNLTGSFLVGFFGTLLADRLVARAELVRYGIMVGFLGSLTTFSSLTWETEGLLTNGAGIRAGLNLTASVILGMLILRLGIVAAETWAARGS